MVRNVYLYGSLGREFGWRHRFDVATLPEAVMALSANYPTFRPKFYSGPAYSFVKGATRRAGSPLAPIELKLQLGPHDIHIIPAAYGQKGGKGIGKIVLGIAMVAFAVVTAGAGLAADGAILAGTAAEVGADGAMLTGAITAAGTGGLLGAGGISLGALGTLSYASIASTGAMMALSGVSQLLAPTPQAAPNASMGANSPDARASFIYNGPTNTTEQGGPVPILYGEMRIGSVLISAVSSAEDISGVIASGAVTGVTSEVTNGY
jgi:predicted phage tail protein